MMSMATAANAKEIEKEGKNDTVLEQVDNQYNVIVNGRLLKVNVLNYHADTYLPVRQIVESVNGEVNWQKAITYITINGKQYMVSPYSNLLGLADEVTSERDIIKMSKEVVYYNSEYLFGNQDVNTSNTQRKTNTQRVCPNCGQVIEEDALFCIKCGYKLY